MIRWNINIKFTITEVHLLFTLILGLHLSLFAISFKGGGLTLNFKPTDEQLTKEGKQGSMVDAGEVGPEGLRTRYIHKPFVVALYRKMPKKQVTQTSELLSLLQGKSQHKSVKVSSSSKLVNVTKGQEIVTSVSQNSDFKLSDEQKKNLIKRLIKEKIAILSNCKEKHLLQDEFLMGTLKVNMRINNKNNVAVPRFNGHGNSKIISSLETCVKTELASLSFPHELSNQEVSFDYKIN